MKHSQHTAERKLEDIPLAQTYTVPPKESKIQGVLVTVLCLAVFAGWGVLLALGV